MGGGGGKGGGQTQTTEIPDWLRDPTIRNLERAETAQQLEYQPWTGLDVAAQTPQQQMANQIGLNTASIFGMTPAGYEGITPTSGMPTATMQGGMAGYSALPMYEQAVAEAQARDPRSAQIRDVMYGSPARARTYGGVNPAGLGGINYVAEMQKKGLV